MRESTFTQWCWVVLWECLDFMVLTILWYHLYFMVWGVLWECLYLMVWEYFGSAVLYGVGVLRECSTLWCVGVHVLYDVGNTLRVLVLCILWCGEYFGSACTLCCCEYC